jgi:hypothetical protein
MGVSSPCYLVSLSPSLHRARSYQEDIARHIVHFHGQDILFDRDEFELELGVSIARSDTLPRKC